MRRLFAPIILSLLCVACTAASPRQLLDKYFKTVLQGGDGVSLWCSEKEPVSLFAVRSYKVLKEEKDTVLLGPNGRAFIVMIESSNKGGQPITKNWQVDVRKTPDGYCLAGIGEPRQ
jgi:hypothetical protein